MGQLFVWRILLVTTPYEDADDAADKRIQVFLFNVQSDCRHRDHAFFSSVLLPLADAKISLINVNLEMSLDIRLKGKIIFHLYIYH